MSSSEPDPSSYDEVDAFDLPEWLGVEQVTWAAAAGLGTGHRVEGTLTADSREPIDCDLLAVDDAYPAPVAPDEVRVRVHQLWRHGEVLLLTDAGRLILALPGSRLDAETVLDAVGRLAHAVGSIEGFGVRLQVGANRRR